MRFGKGGALQAAEKGFNAVILSSREGSCSERFQGDARFFVADPLTIGGSG
jgi:hypothetical protein